MDADAKAALADAVNALIEDQDAGSLHKHLQGVYEVAKRGIPVRLTGRPGVLNPLLDLMLTDFPASERVFQLIDRKRDERDLDPLGAGFDRKGYMRELMAKKRDRQRRLVELVNELRSEDDKIRGSARLDFEQVHANRWFDVRNEREAAARARLRRRLTAEERGDVIAGLWRDVDDELDALAGEQIEGWRRGEPLPTYRRTLVSVTPSKLYFSVSIPL